LNHIHDVSTAAIGGDGTIYFAYDAYGDSVAFLCALNPDGSFKWETDLITDVHPYDGVNILSDPSIGSDGTVYITSWFYRG
jgi:outer membrane protein assembly factor BamB